MKNDSGKLQRFFGGAKNLANVLKSHINIPLLRNFPYIPNGTFELFLSKPFRSGVDVLYGPEGSGKTSFAYNACIRILKNIIGLDSQCSNLRDLSNTIVPIFLRPSAVSSTRAFELEEEVKSVYGVGLGWLLSRGVRLLAFVDGFETDQESLLNILSSAMVQKLIVSDMQLFVTYRSESRELFLNTLSHFGEVYISLYSEFFLRPPDSFQTAAILNTMLVHLAKKRHVSSWLLSGDERIRRNLRILSMAVAVAHSSKELLQAVHDPFSECSRLNDVDELRLGIPNGNSDDEDGGSGDNDNSRSISLYRSNFREYDRTFLSDDNVSSSQRHPFCPRDAIDETDDSSYLRQVLSSPFQITSAYVQLVLNHRCPPSIRTSFVQQGRNLFAECILLCRDLALEMLTKRRSTVVRDLEYLQCNKELLVLSPVTVSVVKENLVPRVLISMDDMYLLHWFASLHLAELTKAVSILGVRLFTYEEDVLRMFADAVRANSTVLLLVEFIAKALVSNEVATANAISILNFADVDLMPSLQSASSGLRGINLSYARLHCRSHRQVSKAYARRSKLVLSQPVAAGTRLFQTLRHFPMRPVVDNVHDKCTRRWLRIVPAKGWIVHMACSGSSVGATVYSLYTGERLRQIELKPVNPRRGWALNGLAIDFVQVAPDGSHIGAVVTHHLFSSYYVWRVADGECRSCRAPLGGEFVSLGFDLHSTYFFVLCTRMLFVYKVGIRRRATPVFPPADFESQMLCSGLTGRQLCVVGEDAKVWLNDGSDHPVIQLMGVSNWTKPVGACINPARDTLAVGFEWWVGVWALRDSATAQPLHMFHLWSNALQDVRHLMFSAAASSFVVVSGSGSVAVLDPIAGATYELFRTFHAMSDFDGVALESEGRTISMCWEQTGVRNDSSHQSGRVQGSRRIITSSNSSGSCSSSRSSTSSTLEVISSCDNDDSSCVTGDCDTHDTDVSYRQSARSTECAALPLPPGELICFVEDSIPEPPPDCHTSGVHALEFFPDEAVVVSAAGREVRLWCIRTGRCVRVIQTSLEEIRCMKLLPAAEGVSGARHAIVVAGRGPDVEVWCGAKAKMTASYQHFESFSGEDVVYSVATSEGGAIAAGGTGGSVSIYFTGHPQPLRIPVPRRGSNCDIRDIMFVQLDTERGTILVAACVSTIFTWTIRNGPATTGQELRQTMRTITTTHYGPILRINQDHNMIVSWSANRVIESALQSGRQSMSMLLDMDWRALCYTHGSRDVIFGENDGDLRILLLAFNETHTIARHPVGVTSLASGLVSDMGAPVVAVGLADGTVCLYILSEENVMELQWCRGMASEYLWLDDF